MSNKKWTESKINDCIDILLKANSVFGAVKQINDVNIFEEEITPNALRKAFQRHDYESPVTFVAGATYQESDTESDDNNIESEFDFGQDFNWEIDADNEEYICREGDKSERVPFEVVEDVVILYCNPFPGQGKPKGEIVDWLATKESTELSLCLNKDAWKSFFDKYNIDKSVHPVAPHLDGKNNDDVIKYVYERGDVLRKQLVKNKYNKVRHLEKSLEEQYRKLLEFREIFQLAEKSDVAENAAYKIDISYRNKSNSAIWLGFIADLHAGKEEMLSQLKNTGNEYNRQIFRERVERGVERSVQAMKDCKEPLEEVVLTNLGDNFEAFLENMRKGQGFGMYGSPKTNFKDVIWANAAYIQAHIDEVDEGTQITFVMNGGNHDRFTEEKGPDSEEFMVYILCQHLKTMFEEYDNVEIVEGAPISSMMLPNGTNLITLHGHRKSVRRSNVESVVSIHGYDSAERYLVAQGHLHRFEVFSTKSDKGMAMVVPSYVGGTTFSASSNFKDSKAQVVASKSLPHENQIIGPFNIE